MTESLQEIEKLVDEYGADCYGDSGSQNETDSRTALLSAITRELAERDEKLSIQAVLTATQTTIIADYRKRIAVLEKALRGCRDDLAWMHDYDGQMNQACCLERIAVIDAALSTAEVK